MFSRLGRLPKPKITPCIHRKNKTGLISPLLPYNETVGNKNVTEFKFIEAPRVSEEFYLPQTTAPDLPYCNVTDNTGVRLTRSVNEDFVSVGDSFSMNRVRVAKRHHAMMQIRNKTLMCLLMVMNVLRQSPSIYRACLTCRQQSTGRLRDNFWSIS